MTPERMLEVVNMTLPEDAQLPVNEKTIELMETFKKVIIQDHENEKATAI